MASAMKAHSFGNLNPNLNNPLCFGLLSQWSGWNPWIHQTTVQQGTGGKIMSLLGQVCHQSHCFLNCILKVENEVAVNCRVNNCCQISLRHEMKMLWVFFNLESLSRFLISPNPPIKGWWLRVLRSIGDLCIHLFLLEKVLKDEQCHNNYMALESKVPGAHPLE